MLAVYLTGALHSFYNANNTCKPRVRTAFCSELFREHMCVSGNDTFVCRVRGPKGPQPALISLICRTRDAPSRPLSKLQDTQTVHPNTRKTNTVHPLEPYCIDLKFNGVFTRPYLLKTCESVLRVQHRLYSDIYWLYTYICHVIV